MSAVDRSPISSAPAPSQPDERTAQFLRILIGWHLLIGAGAAAGIILLWTQAADIASWLRVIISVVLLLAGAASFSASFYIRRKNHRGRVLSLAVNYLGFLIALFWGMHIVGIFTGIDSLAGTFGKGIPYLGLLLIGYLVGALGDRYEETNTNRMLQLRKVGRVLSWAGIGLFLFFVGLIPGLLSLISKFNALLPLLLLGAVIFFGAAVWMMVRAPTGLVMGSKSSDEIMLNGYLFLSPNLLGFLFFFAGPLLLSLYISFTDSDAFGQQNFIGLANYFEIFDLSFARLENIEQLAKEVIDITVYDELSRFSLFGASFVIGARDKLFWIALGNTIRFVLFAVPFSVIPALFLANILNSKLPGMKVYRAIFFVPSIAAVVGVALIWRWLYNSTVGYINYFITNSVDFINGFAGTSIIDPEIGWLSDTSVALIAVIIIAAWQWMGFNTVLFLAGLQNIPKVLYEAATVDGAGSWNQFWKITLPLLAPTTFFVVTTTTIQAMQIFDQVFILTNPPGGPGTSTTTIVLYLYQQGFRNFRQGYASSIAWVLFLLIFGLTLFQFQRQRSTSELA